MQRTHCQTGTWYHEMVVFINTCARVYAVDDYKTTETNILNHEMIMQNEATPVRKPPEANIV